MSTVINIALFFHLRFASLHSVTFPCSHWVNTQQRTPLNDLSWPSAAAVRNTADGSRFSAPGNKFGIRGSSDRYPRRRARARAIRSVSRVRRQFALADSAAVVAISALACMAGSLTSDQRRTELAGFIAASVFSTSSSDGRRVRWPRKLRKLPSAAGEWGLERPECGDDGWFEPATGRSSAACCGRRCRRVWWPDSTTAPSPTWCSSYTTLTGAGAAATAAAAAAAAAAVCCCAARPADSPSTAAGPIAREARSLLAL